MIDNTTLLSQEGKKFWKLPANWEWRVFGGTNGICVVNPRRPTLQKQPNQNVSFIPMESVDDKTGVVAELQTREYSKVRTGFTYFEENDVIFAKITPSMQNGKSAVVRNLVNGFGFGSTEFHVLRPKLSVIPEWVHLFVRRLSFRYEAMEHFQGAVGHKRVPQEFIEQYAIPLPYPENPSMSLQIQRTIVARVESLLAELREIRELHAAIDRDVAQVMASVLEEVFPSLDKDMPNGWVIKTIRELSSKPQYGYTQSATSQEIGPKFLRITDIQDGSVDWDKVPYCEISADAEKKYLLASGDIVFARSGATTGKTYLLSNPPRSVFASYLIRLRTHDVLPEFVSWFFQSPDYWRQITPRGGAQPNMNANLLQEVKVPVPNNMNAQRQIVAHINTILNELKEMNNIQSVDNVLLNQVEQSVLEQAFRGEL